MNRTLGLAIVALLAGCGQTSLDAGADSPRGPLPVDERSPIILSNDGPRDNWQGEYAMVLASAGQITLAGFIVNASSIYPSLDMNVQGWQAMIDAARASGMRNIPDLTASAGTALGRPVDGNIESTVPNRSAGAALIVEAAHRLSRPRHPLVVATGGRLTEIADAYLVDRTVADLVVVVASLGHPSADGQSALMNDPNGDLDTWADEIVARRFRYIQINAYYAQRGDVPDTRVAELPSNAFGTWMTSKLGEILELHEAADQNSIIASGLPSFALDIKRVDGTNPMPSATGDGPTLGAAGDGNGWLVTRGDNAAATARFWEALKSPATYGK